MNRSVAVIFLCAFTGILTCGFVLDGTAASGVDSAPERPDSLLGVFEGRTPCGEIAADFAGFHSDNCEKIKFRLTLYVDPSTGIATTYHLKGTRLTREGRWTVLRSGMQNKSLVVYQLEYGNPKRVLSLLTLDDAVLLFLDRNLRVLPGDASWSYVLNRVQPKR